MSLIDFGTVKQARRAQPLRLAVFTRLAVWKSRRALAKLDDRALADIGISRTDADREAQMTVWDVPASWTRNC